MRNRQTQPHRGFTLIELLVVMAIISALVGILSVGLRTVKMKATNLKQKGEFHGMEISIELFQNEFDRYPDSDRVDWGGVSGYVSGAQRLAEAMEGRDERGFHPRSKWHPDLEAAAGLTLYDETTLKERKPVYFELKHSGFYTPNQLWGGTVVANLEDDVPVITDVFVRNQPADTTIDGKVGMPVLYFKAAPTKRFRVDENRQPVTDPQPNDYKDWVYDFEDNIDLLNLPWLREPDTDTDNAIAPHYQPENNNKYPGAATPAQLFYEIITQRQDPNTNFYKPYNLNTFILISAGWDGKFGTDDDLMNFEY